MRELMTFKRNVYTPEEQAALDAWRKLEGPSFPAMPVGVGQPKDYDVVSGFEMYWYAKGWDKDNPLWYDYSYAKDTWYGDVPAMPAMREPMGMSMFPSELGWEAFPPSTPMLGDGYDFELYYYQPIFAGDSFTTKIVGQECTDLTEDGSTVRYFIRVITTEMYNQKGKLVARGVFHWPTFLHKFADGNNPKTRDEIMQVRMELMQANMGSRTERYVRPSHVYTDADWEILKGIWANEKIRGKETLYWEDVNVGDEPLPTAENPITEYDAGRYTGMHHTVGTISGDTVKDYVMGKRVERRFYKREDGVIDVQKDNRTHFLNFIGRNFCLRTITNWCGDDGFVRKVGWRMVNDYKPEEQFNHFPEDHFRPSWLLKVPYLKEAGKFINTHGAGPDCAICKAYVTEKFIDEDTGDHMVMLTAWCEDLDGNIFQECEFSVALPTRDGQPAIKFEK